MRLPTSLPGFGLACLLVPALALGQGPPPPQAPPSSQTPSAPLDYVFTNVAGLLFFHVRPEMGSEFEAVAGRIAAVLAASDDETRRRQAEGWRIYRSVEAHDNRIYVFVFDPVAPGADYDPVRLLSDEAPDEVQALYTRLKASILRIERMGLERIGPPPGEGGGLARTPG
jgi:hypothetical protein